MQPRGQLTKGQST